MSALVKSGHDNKNVQCFCICVIPPPLAVPGAVGGADLLMPAHESLHFLQGNGAIVVGIHCLEYALVRRLKLLQ